MLTLIEVEREIPQYIDVLATIALSTAYKRGQVKTSTTFEEFTSAIQEELEELKNASVVCSREQLGALQSMQNNSSAKFSAMFEHSAKDTVGDEIADIIVTCLSMARFFDIDIDTHILMKMEYNDNR